MKKNIKKWICMASVALLGMGCLGGCSSANKVDSEVRSQESNTEMTANDSFAEDVKEKGFLIVGCKMDVPGLGYYEESEGWSGIEVELAYQTAANLFGVDKAEAKEKALVHFVGVTVADREEKLESGEIDLMLATYTITPERAEKFALSDSYYTDYIGIMVLDHGKDSDSLGSTSIQSTADLDGKYVGVPRNATTRADFIKYIETMNTAKPNPIFCEYESYEILYNALKDGTISAMAVDVSILNGYMDKQTRILNDRFAGQHYGAAVTKGHESLLSYVNQAIEE